MGRALLRNGFQTTQQCRAMVLEYKLLLLSNVCRALLRTNVFHAREAVKNAETLRLDASTLSEEQTREVESTTLETLEQRLRDADKTC